MKSTNAGNTARKRKTQKYQGFKEFIDVFCTLEVAEILTKLRPIVDSLNGEDFSCSWDAESTKLKVSAVFKTKKERTNFENVTL